MVNQVIPIIDRIKNNIYIPTNVSKGSIGVIDPSVKKENFSSKPISNLLRYSNNDNYWYKLINNSKILYFNYQDCAEQDGKIFEIFNNQLFNAIEIQKPEKLIIDLRNNSGGNSAILKPFLEKLKTNYLNKKGSLYILIGKLYIISFQILLVLHLKWFLKGFLILIYVFQRNQ